MSDTRKSLFFAVAFVAAAASVYAGLASRERVDSMPLKGEHRPTDTLLASKQNEPEFSEARFFRDISRLLKEEYVEPIQDDQKLAEGAVRGMVGSLGDPRSTFMDKAEFAAYLKSEKGQYEGIGAELTLQVDEGQRAELPKPERPDPEAPAQPLAQQLLIPRLVVAAVTPGGPADRAGVKPGDWVEAVDDHWVINSREVNRFREASKEFQAGKKTAEEMKVLRRRIRALSESSILPMRAKDRLMLGLEGTVNVVWNRGEQTLRTTLAKASSEMPASGVQPGGAFRMAFEPGSAATLKRAVAGKSAITIDLRSCVNGGFGELVPALEAVAPAGDYGVIATERDKKPTPVTVKAGRSQPLSITVLADASTRRAAEAFVLALKHRGLVKLATKTAGDTAVIEARPLPSGSGYTLVVGEYRMAPKPKKPPSKTVHAIGLGKHAGAMAI